MIIESRLLYRSSVRRVGTRTPEVLAGGLLILFTDCAPEALAEFSVLHDHPGFEGSLEPGQIIVIGGRSYPITAVGDRATQNFRDLGHIVLKFDGSVRPELPGHVHVHGACPESVEPGSWIELRAP